MKKMNYIKKFWGCGKILVAAPLFYFSCSSQQSKIENIDLVKTLVDFYNGSGRKIVSFDSTDFIKHSDPKIFFRNLKGDTLFIIDHTRHNIPEKLTVRIGYGFEEVYDLKGPEKKREREIVKEVLENILGNLKH